MVGAGMKKNNPIEMTRAIVRVCGDFARNQVSFVFFVQYNEETRTVRVQMVCSAYSFAVSLALGHFESFLSGISSTDYKHRIGRLQRRELRSVCRRAHLRRRSTPGRLRLRQLYDQLLVATNSDEYRSAAKRVADAKLAAHFKLAKVFRIRSPHLEAKYNIHKAQLQN